MDTVLRETTPGADLRGASSRLVGLGIYLAVAAFVALWSLVAITLIHGSEFWFADPTNETHLAINLCCIGVAVVFAARVQGPLDYKLSQALVGTALIFGVYALTILGARLFFSRQMLASAVACAALASCLVVLLRHRLTRQRVALIGPLVGNAVGNIPFGRIISDPETDLRSFDVVLVSFTGTVSTAWARALSRAMLAGCKVRHVGEYVEELRGAVSLEHFEIEHLPPNGIASYRLLKRLLDIGLVVFILPIVIPVLILGIVLVLITSGWPIFFVQERVGLGGRPFRMWKLRSMRPERADEAVRAAVPGDRRVTPFGRIIRRFRIDELPQLWNVLKGDMSLIGPRPEAVALHREYGQRLPNYDYRYLVRPGITGWAQVNTPPSASAEEARRKLTYDLFYVKKLSLFLDLQIVLRTFWTITSGSGVR